MAWPKWLLREIAQVACIVCAQLLADDCRSFYVNPCFYLAALSPNLYGSNINNKLRAVCSLFSFAAAQARVTQCSLVPRTCFLSQNRANQIAAFIFL